MENGHTTTYTPMGKMATDCAALHNTQLNTMVKVNFQSTSNLVSKFKKKVWPVTIHNKKKTHGL